MPTVSIGEEVTSYGWRELDYVAQHHEFRAGTCDLDRVAGCVLRGGLGLAGSQGWKSTSGQPQQHRCGLESAVAGRLAQLLGSRVWLDDGGWRGAHRSVQR